MNKKFEGAVSAAARTDRAVTSVFESMEDYFALSMGTNIRYLRCCVAPPGQFRHARDSGPCRCIPAKHVGAAIGRHEVFRGKSEQTRAIQELELEFIHTQMAHGPMLRVEVYARAFLTLMLRHLRGLRRRS
jgi:hypothetical protein